MDDTFIHSTAEEHMDDLMDLFKVLRKYDLKLSPHKCQFFKKKTRISDTARQSMLYPIKRQMQCHKKLRITKDS